MTSAPTWSSSRSAPTARSRCSASTPSDLLVDVAGYFTATSGPATNTGRLTVFGSTRVVDTRQTPPVGFGALAAGGGATLDITPPLPDRRDRGGPEPHDPGSRTPGGSSPPTPAGSTSEVSNLNVTGPGQTRAALAITDVPPVGTVRVLGFAATSLIVDIYGYFHSGSDS